MIKSGQNWWLLHDGPQGDDSDQVPPPQTRVGYKFLFDDEKIRWDLIIIIVLRDFNNFIAGACVEAKIVENMLIRADMLV